MSEKPLPTIDPDSAPFWNAAREGRLDVPQCGGCGRAYFPPRLLCPHCHEEIGGWLTCEGRGTIYSFTVARRPAHPGFEDEVPYVVALIELDEGVRMMSNVVTDDPDSVRIGDSVEVFFERASEEITMPKFRRLGAGEG